MGDSENVRLERIKRLLDDLRYEVTRGMMEREIDETMGFDFYVPISVAIPDGVVQCQFRTRPIHRHHMNVKDMEPRLKVIK